jgi:GrpB-like predicted nucleotidyltransferase (UPF0157 family)
MLHSMLEPHQVSWETEFTELRAICANALGSLALRIEHVGSTSVPDLLAKPILDVDIVISGYENFAQVVKILEGLGYFHNGDQGIPEREAFNCADEFTPHVSPARKWMTHHLYVCPEHGRELRRHIAFRDALRGNVRLRQEYEKMKLNIVGRSGGDRTTYALIKDEECRKFIDEIVERDFARSDESSA